MAKQGGAYLPLRGGVTTAKAFRGKEGFKESQKLQDKIFKKFKKTVQKTPSKKIESPLKGKGISHHHDKSAKQIKKDIIQQQTTIKNKNPVGSRDPWKSPIKLQGGGRALRGLGKAFMKGGKV